MRSSERGVNSILTTILQFWPTSWRDRIFCLVASDSARREDHFQKKICPKRTFPSNFVKLVSKILYLFLAEKMVVCCCCCCCLFCLFCCCFCFVFLCFCCFCCLLWFVCFFLFCLVVFVVLFCCFVLFVATLSDYFFFKLKLSSSWERCFQGKNYTMHGLGIA